MLCRGVFLKDGPAIYQVRTRLTTNAPAADIVLVIDESSSMTTEHGWLPLMVREMDKFLRDRDIGKVEGRPNLFAVVGFGGNAFNFRARHYRTATGSALFSAEEFERIVRINVRLHGNLEDGYEAVSYALTNLTHSNGTQALRKRQTGIATNVILITDEDRYQADSTRQFTKDYVRELLLRENALFNVAVNQNLTAADGRRAFGVDFQRNTYIADGSGNFVEPTPNGVTFGEAFGNTTRDYTQLALEPAIKGAVWDLKVLRTNVMETTDSFTRGFVSLKAREINQQVNECRECTCNGVSGQTECRRAADQRTCCFKAGATVS